MKDEVTVTVASIPQREAGLQTMMEQLLPQCDRMCICLNDYAYVPKFVANAKKVTYLHLVGDAAISDHGKFYWNHEIRGYHFTVDDDILYPPDYVAHTVERIDAYRRRAVVGYHGTDFLLRNGRLLTHSRVSIKRLRFGDNLPSDRRVYMLGTGVLAYHTDTMKFPYKTLRYGGTDEQIAIYCQHMEIPMVCLAHPEGWLIDNLKVSLLQNIGGNGKLAALADRVIRSHPNWHLPQL